ncbi:MAG: presqualene diphosphate synthase HpnD [Ignavibacterium sp.]
MEEDLAKEISKKSKSSFYYAFNLLPEPKRDAMNTVYAFCRETDDIVDEGLEDENIKYQKLVKWRLELEKAFKNNSSNYLLNKLAKIVMQFNIPIDYLFELIKGMEMDLQNKQYRNFDELKLYCYRVASTVGLMCIEIFGYKNPSAKLFAENLGIALQLTNIIRDVSKDAKKGRIYLPQDELKIYNYSEQDLFNKKYNFNFISLMEFQTNRAKEYFYKATESLDKNDKPSMFAARAMQHIYYRLLEKIIKEKYDVYNKNIRVSTFEKVSISLGVWLKYNLVSVS